MPRMDDEFAIPPVEVDPVEPVAPRVVPPVAARRTVDAPAPTAPQQPTDQLGDAAARSELDARAASEPADVGERATVHDAAAHGNPIAQAIERAARGEVREHDDAPAGTVAGDIDPNAQMLGGAAASAASGQAAQVRRDARAVAADDLHGPEGTDRLAPVQRRSDEQGRQWRDEQAARLLRDGRSADELDDWATDAPAG